MNKTFLLLFVFFSLLSATKYFAPWYGKVVGVSDGDTLKILAQNKVTKVRLYGIDSPEKRQAFGQKAKQRTSDLCFGQEVRVEPLTLDRYGRVIARVYLKDERDLGNILVEEGLAWWYHHYAKTDDKLKNLQDRARRQKLGLWADAHPTPPWEFRRTKKHKPHKD